MTAHCSHLHRAVSQQECGLCFLQGNADKDCYVKADGNWIMVKGDLYKAMRETGWDACRAKHIKPAGEDTL